jgi:hypothetical protein
MYKCYPQDILMRLHFVVLYFEVRYSTISKPVSQFSSTLCLPFILAGIGDLQLTRCCRSPSKDRQHLQVVQYTEAVSRIAHTSKGTPTCEFQIPRARATCECLFLSAASEADWWMNLRRTAGSWYSAIPSITTTTSVLHSYMTRYITYLVKAVVCLHNTLQQDGHGSRQWKIYNGSWCKR